MGIFKEQLDLKGCYSVNDLWPELIRKLGIDKSKEAISQALDLQNMQGNSNTIPVLLVETCGLALINFEALHAYLGYYPFEDRMVLLFSTQNRSIQLLKETI